jgi:hypothetical protein
MGGTIMKFGFSKLEYINNIHSRKSSIRPGDWTQN